MVCSEWHAVLWSREQISVGIGRREAEQVGREGSAKREVIESHQHSKAQHLGWKHCGGQIGGK